MKGEEVGKLSLGLAMVVRDEERVLARALESMHGIFDEIVVVDLGSKDHTIDVALRHNAEVFEYRWGGSVAKVRNVSYAKSRADYVMWMDGEEFLTTEARSRLLELRERLGEADGWWTRDQLWPDETTIKNIVEIQKITGVFSPKSVPKRSPVGMPRILLNSGAIRWKGAVHAIVEIPKGWRVEMSDVHVSHIEAPRRN